MKPLVFTTSLALLSSIVTTAITLPKPIDFPPVAKRLLKGQQPPIIPFTTLRLTAVAITRTPNGTLSSVSFDILRAIAYPQKLLPLATCSKEWPQFRETAESSAINMDCKPSKYFRTITFGDTLSDVPSSIANSSTGLIVEFQRFGDHEYRIIVTPVGSGWWRSSDKGWGPVPLCSFGLAVSDKPVQNSIIATCHGFRAPNPATNDTERCDQLSELFNGVRLEDQGCCKWCPGVVIVLLD